MPLQIVRNDITKMTVDAIVNAANSSLLGGGGVDGCIHRAAGPGLLDECRTLGGCETGNAKITGAYDLPCKYVIHTVGPVYKDGKCGERELLISCYRKSLEIAKQNKCETVAFPLISSGIYGYPKAEALHVAVDTIGEFLLQNDMTVYIVIFDKKSYQISEKLFCDIQEFIDDNYVETVVASQSVSRNIEYERRLSPDHLFIKRKNKRAVFEEISSPQYAANAYMSESVTDESYPPFSLENALEQIDESFSEMLLRKIDESGMKDSECYKKANIDRKLFSKIRSDSHYKPSKPTVIAFAIALGLSLADTKEMLMKAGFALSHSNKFDIIVEYFISKGNYNIFEINEALFAFDQCLIGGV